MEDIRETIKKELVVKEAITSEDVKFFKQFLAITEKGKVIVKADRAKATYTDLILLYLVGTKLAHMAGLRETPHSSLEELAKSLSIAPNAVAARVNECVDRGEVERKQRGEYEATVGGITSLKERLTRLTQASGHA
ncbi:MAG: hypothetical protein NZ941_01210 [Candidatus Caldarchaeum sp.]|nr:hypothetical protein [Candidatus Caldarchaeum sp.]MDW7977836.1 hypothetical protein [Candidatus Caldarchaeum sp.]